MRLGVDGTMPGAMYAEIYPLLWELQRKGEMAKLREVFSKLLVMVNLDQQIPGTRSYMFQKRGIFKNDRLAQGRLLLDGGAEGRDGLGARGTEAVSEGLNRDN